MLEASFSACLRALQERLDAAADPQTKVWWEAYLRGEIGFRGLSTATLRREIRAWQGEEATLALSSEEIAALAFALLREEPCEDRIAGLLLLQAPVLKNKLLSWEALLRGLGDAFEVGRLSTWNLCDTACIYVLSPMIQAEGLSCAEALSPWKDKPLVWQRRASVVAFVHLARKGETALPGVLDVIEDHCQALIRSSERFAQTAVGWVWREIERHSPERYERFLLAHLRFFSSEGLRYATEKLAAAEQKAWRERHKAAKRPS